jgi:hypothetical protein
MAMLEGTVTIDPVTAVASGAGAAKEIFDVMDSGMSYPGTLTPVAKAAAREQLAVLARAVAKIVPHIVSHAVVTASVASGIPVSTAGTAAAQTGATTAPGAATGTVA